MSQARARNILILQGHPDPAGGRLCHALAQAYAEGARDGGHTVRLMEIANLDFPLLRSEAEFEGADTPPAIAEAQGSFRWADHLVIIFPLWLGTMPALLKAFLEQTFRPKFAFAYSPKGFPQKLLKGKSARVIVTMGMPTLLYRLFFLAHGVRGLERNILRFAGISPVRETFLGMVAATSDATRKRWLSKMRHLGRRPR